MTFLFVRLLFNIFVVVLAFAVLLLYMQRRSYDRSINIYEIFFHSLHAVLTGRQFTEAQYRSSWGTSLKRHSI